MKDKKIKSCEFLYPSEQIDLMSFLDRFKIKQSEFDISKLKITYDEDWSGVYYEGDRPTTMLTLEYEI